MNDFEYSDAMDQSHVITTELVEQMSAVLLEGQATPKQLHEVIFAVLNEAPPMLVANGLSWFVMNAAMDMAAKKGMEQNDEPS